MKLKTLMNLDMEMKKKQQAIDIDIIKARKSGQKIDSDTIIALIKKHYTK